MSATIERRFHLGTGPGRGGGSRRTVKAEAAPAPSPEPAEDDKVHPLAQRMAMAIRCQQLIESGVVADQATLAAMTGMTRAWITMVMRLNHLAPDIQETILGLPHGVAIDGKWLKEISHTTDWAEQRKAWLQGLD